VGVDLGASKIATGLIDPRGHIVARCRVATNAHEGLGAVVERIAHCIAELERSLPGGKRIAALGICSPGPVDHCTGVLLDPPNIPGLHNAPLRHALCERLGMPVRLEHDAKAAALGEFTYGAGRGERSLVYIVVGSGVGAAIIIDGQLYRGLHNAAGEVGHITLDADGDLCSCGCRGCVETFLSGPRLALRYRRALECERWMAPSEAITGERVVQWAGQGDALAQQVMVEAGQALGVAIASLAMILDIELYVVGSSVAKAGDLLLDPARRMVPRCSFRSVGARVRIVTTALWDDGPILGCGQLARQVLSA
jgi:glucokinase